MSDSKPYPITNKIRTRIEPIDTRLKNGDPGDVLAHAQDDLRFLLTVLYQTVAWASAMLPTPFPNPSRPQPPDNIPVYELAVCDDDEYIITDMARDDWTLAGRCTYDADLLVFWRVAGRMPGGYA